MGANRRYAKQIDERSIQRGVPYTLHDEQLQLHKYPLTRPPKPLSGVAWVHYPHGHVLVRCQIVAWTSRAVAVRWKTPIDEIHKAWLWLHALESAPPELYH